METSILESASLGRRAQVWLLTGTVIKWGLLAFGLGFLYFTGSSISLWEYLLWIAGAMGTSVAVWVFQVEADSVAFFKLMLWYTSVAFDLSFAGFLIRFTGGLNSTFVLIYPTILVAVVAARPYRRDLVIVGIMGHASYVGSLYSKYGSLDFYFSSVFWSQCFLITSAFALTFVAVDLFNRQSNELRLANAQLKIASAELQRLSLTDPLTGLFNTRYFNTRLEEELRTAKQKGSDLSLLMLEVDFLPVYNAMFGYRQGDNLMRLIAGKLKESLGEESLLCRYRGEHLALILPDVGSEQARTVARELQEKILEIEFPGKDRMPHGSMRVSAGVATYPKHADTVDDLIRCADEALFMAKENAFNSAQVYASLVEDLRPLSRGCGSIIDCLETMIRIIHAKDRYTYGHSHRVMKYCEAIAAHLGVDPSTIDRIKLAGLLHDIGKIEVPRDILVKTGPLNYTERSTIEKHCIFGADIVGTIEELNDIVPLIKHHHERWDGHGYPSKLAGKAIPFGARILAVADSLDAMLSRRPYRDAMSLAEVSSELRRCSGTQFDPDVVAACLEALPEISSIYVGYLCWLIR